MRGPVAAFACVALAALAPAMPAEAAGGQGRLALGSAAGITVAGDALTSPPELVLPDAADPSWSPDGTQLAFTRRGGAPGGLGIANADGSGVRMLTTTFPPTSATDVTGFADLTPAWSPDGTRLAFVRATLRGSDIWTIAADGSGAHRLIPAMGPDHIDQDPRYLPDGSRLVFTGDGDDLWSARTDGTHLRRLVSLAYFDAVASTDGRTYAIERGGGPTYVIGNDGTGLRRVGGARTWPIAFSRDGTRLVLGHVSPRGKVTGAASIFDPSGTAPPRTPVPSPEGLGSIVFGAPSWFTPAPRRHAAMPTDRDAPASILADDVTGRMLRLTPGTAHRSVTLHRSFGSLLTVDATGIRSIAVAWAEDRRHPRWRDVTKPDAFSGTVLPLAAGTYHLLVRATDVLGHASKRPAEVIVKLKQ